jgi:hypothetical protein
MDPTTLDMNDPMSTLEPDYLRNLQEEEDDDDEEEDDDESIWEKITGAFR